jgi:hypothetical protein
MDERRTRAEPDDPVGADARSNGAGPPPHEADPAAILVLLDALRLAAPAELQDRLTALMREALLTLRALIDWYLERLDAAPAEREVEDIPID